MKSTAARLSAAVLMLGLSFGGSSHAETLPAKSKLGYEAMAVDPAVREEGARDTVLKKDGKEVLRVPHAVPVSFSPDGRILLLMEAAADDDCLHFLLDVTTGIKPERLEKLDRIGGRYVEKVEWSKDGKTITFTYNAGLTDQRAETIIVADHCGGPLRGGGRQRKITESISAAQFWKLAIMPLMVL